MQHGTIYVTKQVKSQLDSELVERVEKILGETIVGMFTANIFSKLLSLGKPKTAQAFSNDVDEMILEHENAREAARQFNNH